MKKGHETQSFGPFLGVLGVFSAGFGFETGAFEIYGKTDFEYSETGPECAYLSEQKCPEKSKTRKKHDGTTPQKHAKNTQKHPLNTV